MIGTEQKATPASGRQDERRDFVEAYVLIQTDSDGGPLAESLKSIPEILSAQDVGGAYDVIAVARSTSMQQLMDAVIPRIRSLPGVTRALPAPLLHQAA